VSDTNRQFRLGVSFADLLGLLFVGLKLTGHIDWSWLWVLAPFWITFLLAFALILAFAVGGRR
jgi:hypothetical protein